MGGERAAGAADRRPIAPLRILAGEKERVALWMLAHLPQLTELPGGYEAIGVVRGTEIVGGCLYTDYRPCVGGGNIVMWAVGHGWLSKRTIRELLGYPFNQLNCHRATALIARGNKPSREMVERIGWRLEGKMRRGFDTRQDLLIYGLLKSECGWI